MDRTTEVSLPQLIARLNGQPPAEPLPRGPGPRENGQEGPEGGPASHPALEDSDKNVRKAATLALADIGPDAHQAVPGLCEVLLNDHDVAVRRRAAVSLGEIGTGEAVAALEEASGLGRQRGGPGDGGCRPGGDRRRAGRAAA